MFGDMAGIDDDIALVRDLLAWADLTPAAAAKKIGAANTTLNRFANGTARFRLGRATVDKLRAAFPDFPGFVERPPMNGVPQKMEGASAERLREDLPVYGTALGAEKVVDGESIEQTTLNQGEIIQYAKRPVLLNGNAAAYGLWVSGSSMEPRHMDGEMILVDPKGRVKNGEDVVVYLRPKNGDDDGSAARSVLVKRLVRRTANYIELQQYTPAVTFRIGADEVLRIERVIPWAELLS